jgi:hypothetical protein
MDREEAFLKHLEQSTTLKKLSASQSMAASTSAHTHRQKSTGTKQKKTRPESHRKAYGEYSDLDLIVSGCYQLDDEQLNTFDNFTNMLSSFDHYDMVCNRLHTSYI